MLPTPPPRLPSDGDRFWRMRFVLCDPVFDTLSSNEPDPLVAWSSEVSEVLDPPEGLRGGGGCRDEDVRRLLPLAPSAPVCSTRLQLFGTLMTHRL